MSERLTPPDWSTLNPDMLLNVGDARYYYESFTEVVDNQAQENKLGIGDLDGRVTALEHSIPVGPGGDGAYLHLGGTPERYPTLTEMSDGDTKDVTSFMVIARNDGIYFYNPKTKVVIPPKKGGGTIAVHGQFPHIFQSNHSIKHTGRVGLSGVYLAKTSDLELDLEFLSATTVQVLVVVNDLGEEYQTVLCPDGMASRIFRNGIQVADWQINQGGGGGGGTVDPAIIKEIRDRLEALEAHDHIDNITELKDVDLDHVLDAEGLVYMDETGRIKGGSKNPLLSEGSTHVHSNAVGAAPVISGANITSAVVARNNTIIFRGKLTKQVQLPGVVSFDTFKPSTSQVREGRTTFIVNTSDVNLTVKINTGGMFYIGGNMDSTNAVVPPKTVYVYNPGLIDNGSGAIIQCWIYMGTYALRATDLTGITAEIQALQTKNAEQDVEILQTQADIAVAEAGIASLNTRIDDHLVNFNKISTGGQLISWNTLGADPVSTSGDVTAANIGSCPFVVGMGTVTGKKFIMAEIADRTVTSLTSTQVREGRTTYLVNMGSVTRSVELTGGCKFNMSGSLVTTKQTIPAKAVWVFTPGIYNNGDKVWTFNGSFSTEAIDFKGLVNRVTALEAGGGPGSGGVTDFTGLTDTPANYTGQKNKFLAVKDDESGVEFVTTPSIDTKPLEDRIDTIDQNIVNHVADFELMRDGHIPTSWNGLGAKTITSSNDVTAANITESPFCVGTGTVAGKKFILPDIAELGVMSLGADQVREGRATYIVNLSNVDRTVEVTAGCKINITGGATSMSQTIPRKTAWMLSPGVFAGDKVWTFLGALSAETLDIAALVDRLAAVEGRPLIEKFTDLADTPANYRPGQVLRYNQAGDGIISTEFGLKHLTDTPSDFGGQRGKMLVVNSGETAMEFAAVPNVSGIQTEVDNLHNDIIAVQNTNTIQGNSITALDTRVTAVEADVTIKESEVLYNGLIGTGNYTQANAATFNPCILKGTSSRTLELPEIVDATATPTALQSRAGRMLMICNFSESVTLTASGNAVGRQLRTWDATVLGSKRLAGKQCMEVVAMKVGTTYYWQIIREWTVG